MRTILTILASLLAVIGMAGLALGLAVVIDAFPFGESHHTLNHPKRVAEVFAGSLSVLGLSIAAGFGAALLGRLDRIARALEDAAQPRRGP